MLIKSHVVLVNKKERMPEWKPAKSRTGQA
jgi:hypothetical protein